MRQDDTRRRSRQALAPLTIRLPLGHHPDELDQAIAKAIGRPVREASRWQVVKRSLDARKKGDIQIQYTLELSTEVAPVRGIAGLFPIAGIGPTADAKSDSGLPDLSGSTAETVEKSAAGSVGEPTTESVAESAGNRPVVVGCGPAGLFAALALALAGRCPILLERGQPVANRKQAVDLFWAEGILDPENNVQFGEGGAGTFSDGKLNSNIKDPRCRAVLEELVLCGAPTDILIDPRPHVGTDLLSGAVTRIREKIEGLGGEIRFGARLDDVLAGNSDCDLPDQRTGTLAESTPFRVMGVRYSQLLPDGSRKRCHLTTPAVILAIGHSARDTLEILAKRSFNLIPKPFSVGVRIEHRQQAINASQYGPQAGHPDLPAASYKLAVHLPSGRSVYTFCMCPGGQVIASASEPGGIVTNGMSYQARDQVNANSALLVEVTPDDFPEPGPLGGVALQRSLEQQAYRLAGSTYRAPAQLVGDFLAGRPSTGPDMTHPSYRPGVTWTDLRGCLPDFVSSALHEALPLLDRKLHGFAAADAVLTGVETRSSSPVRIARNDQLQSNWRGVFPCGEGAGYAGGILSAAVDGLRCAEAVLTADLPVAKP